MFFPSGINYAYYVIPPPTSGTITIEKHVTGAPQGANPAFPFKRSLSFDPSGFTLHDGQSNTAYRAGGETWTVTEGAVDDYRLASIDCTALNASGGPGSSTYTTSGAELQINLVAGDRVTCVFTNTWIPPTGSLRITKITYGGVGGFSFDVTPDGSGDAHTVTATTAQEGVPTDATPSLSTLAPGTYTITEHQAQSAVGSWKLTGLECDQTSRETSGAIQVTISRGTETACTFTNTFTPNGSISISKVSDIEQPPLNEPAGDWALTSIDCNGVQMPFSQGATEVALTRSQPQLKCVFTNTFSTKPPPDPQPSEPAELVPPTPQPPTAPELPSDPLIPSNPESPPGPTKPENNNPAPAGEPWADLAVTSRPKSAAVSGRTPIADLVTVTNHGPGDAERVVLVYQALSGAKLVSVAPRHGQCGRSLPLVCRLGTLKAGQKVTIEVVPEATKRSGSFRIRDAVGTTTYDPRLINDVGVEHVYIERPVPPPPSPIVGPPS